jgi:hypothetical protein
MNSNFNKAEASDTFCILPWIHQYVGPAGDVKPCCLYQMNMSIGDYKNQNLKEIWNNEQTRQLRLDMLDGKQVPGCRKCTVRQDLSITPRDQFNNIYINDRTKKIVDSTLSDGTVSNHELHYIDVRFNNLCNLRCRTCGPDYSTSWIDDHDKVNQKIHGSNKKSTYQFSGPTDESLLKDIIPHLSTVSSIYFAGGEPLMQREHYEILKTLIDINHPGLYDQKKLVIHYNTNFMNLKLGNYYAPDFWKLFPNVTVNASLDGSHQRAEYWRKGTKWKKIIENRMLLKSICPQVKFKINYTASWPNIYNLFDLHREWTDLDLISVDDLNLNFLDNPVYYSLKSLPNWKKDNIRDYMMEYKDWLIERRAKSINQVSDLLKFMYDENHGDDFAFKNYFKNYCLTLDEIRNENFWEIFPEHSDLKHYFIDK